MSAQASEAIPSWDLSDLYEGPDSPRIESDLKQALEAA